MSILMYSVLILFFVENCTNVWRRSESNTLI
jgi:hypothetical protein